MGGPYHPPAQFFLTHGTGCTSEMIQLRVESTAINSLDSVKHKPAIYIVARDVLALGPTSMILDVSPVRACNPH